jgi:hypothetical protein
MTAREPHRTILLVTLAFFLGAIAGGSLVRYLFVRRQLTAFEAGPGVAQRLALESALQSELELDDAQVEALSEILDAHAESDRLLRVDREPRLAPRRAELRQAVRAILRPEQLEAFDALSDRYEARIAQWLTRAP